MTPPPPPPYLDPVEEMRYALAEGDAEAPPPGLLAGVRAAALRARAPGRPAPLPPEISPLEAYRRSATNLDALLGELSDDDWHRPALRDLNVQGLVGHLIGVEHHFQAGAGLAEPISGATDHVASTDPYARAQAGRPPADTRAEFRTLVDATLAGLAGADGDAMAAPVAMHHVTLPLGSLLIVRAFELWTHDEDIRRATGRQLGDPDASSLQLMTGLAVALLPAGMAGAGRDAAGRTVRLVLTGNGGGTWPAVLGDDASPPSAPAVRIVADAVGFCRLVANRDEQDSFAALISGDEALARDLFAAAAALAFD